MARIWEKATIVSELPSGRVTVDSGGTSWVRILSEKFRLNDGSDYTYIHFGNQLIR